MTVAVGRRMGAKLAFTVAVLLGALALASSAPVLTPPLNTNNHWLFDGQNRVWMLQNAQNRLVLTLDAESGIVRLSSPIAANIQVRADYTPGALRLTQAPASDNAPVLLMDDSPDNLAHPTAQSATQTTWAGPVPRHTLWLVWRRNVSQQAGKPAATIFYTAYRLQVDLPTPLLNSQQTGAPDVQVYAGGQIVPPTLWGIDQPHNRLWFAGSLEGADIQVQMNANAVTFNTTVGWQQAMPETPVRIQGLVNEGQPSAAIETVMAPVFDPTYSLPLNNAGIPTTSNGNQPLMYTYSKLWIFWSSTRVGAGATNPNTDVYYESIVPQL